MGRSAIHITIMPNSTSLKEFRNTCFRAFFITALLALQWGLIFEFVFGDPVFKPIAEKVLGYHLWREPVMSLARKVRDSGRCIYTGRRLEDDPYLRANVVRSFLTHLREMDSFELSSAERWIVADEVSIDEFLAPAQRRVDAYEGKDNPAQLRKEYKTVNFGDGGGSLKLVSDEMLKGDFTIYSETNFGRSMIPGRSIQVVPEDVAEEIKRKRNLYEWSVLDTFSGYGRTIFSLKTYGPVYRCKYERIDRNKPDDAEKKAEYGFDPKSCDQTKLDIQRLRTEKGGDGHINYLFVSNCGSVFGMPENQNEAERRYLLYF